ncbi:MAG TPA: hypothetical protein VII91_07330 [Bauldia sp.]
MVQTILIGIAAGLAAALLFLAPASGTVLAFPLFVLTGLPLAIVTLGWGTLAGATAAATAAIVVSLIYPASVAAPAIFLCLFGIPIVWLARLVGLTRPQGNGDAGLQWYPLSRLLLQVTVVAALAAVVVGLITGYQSEAMVSDATAAFLDLAVGIGSLAHPPTAADTEPMVRIYVALVPFMVSLLLTVIMVFDLWIGGLVARASSRFIRPPEPLWSVALPNEILIGFPIAVVLSLLLPGALGQIAEAFAGALACGLLLVGLAVLHAATLGSSARIPILVLVYLLAIFSGILILLLIVVGLVDNFAHFRARRLANRSLPN